jgi:hypothetical protein
LTMTPAELEQKFAEALRRALGTTEAGAPVVHVAAAAAPVVNITPEIKATLPALTEPLEVVDTQRFGGAFEYELKVDRTAEGFIKTARLVPVLFHPFVTEGTP